jgi:hypothetical protein
MHHNAVAKSVMRTPTTPYVQAGARRALRVAVDVIAGQPLHDAAAPPIHSPQSANGLL